MEDLGFDHPSLIDRAYQEIRKSILVGDMPPGHKLVVNDLVEQWKISATPIKQALNRLVSEELVEVVPRRGMRVKTYDAQDLVDTFEIRLLYETHCCKMAVKKIDDHPEVEEELDDVMRKSALSLADECNYTAHYHFDEQFHMLLVSLSGNRKMIRDFERLHANIITFGIYASRQSPLWRQRETVEEHTRILDALHQRSQKDMVAAMRTHLDNTVKDMLTFFHPKSGRLIVQK
ncbi:MAG: GntR family transcriptional regulator [Planctomycetaceae bacterium]|nr:GntR family transcriptional regulator [Planctomycetaceae bacterium]